MEFWTLVGVIAIVCGIVLAVRYGVRTYQAFTVANPVDTLGEAKPAAKNGAKAALGLLVVGIGIKLIIGAFAMLMVFSITPARAEGNDIRYPVYQGTVMKDKIARHIASRENVEAPRTGKLTRKAVIRRGLFGEILSPMHDYRAPLERCGYRVEYASFWNQASGADVEITHSMATFGALHSDSKRVFTIDAPIWAHGVGMKARHSRTANFPTFAHPNVAGAVNVPIGGGHVGAPNQAKPYILSMLGCGTEPPRRGRRGR